MYICDLIHTHTHTHTHTQRERERERERETKNKIELVTLLRGYRRWEKENVKERQILKQTIYI
jgi:hypothetical protein